MQGQTVKGVSVVTLGIIGTTTSPTHCLLTQINSLIFTLTHADRVVDVYLLYNKSENLRFLTPLDVNLHCFYVILLGKNEPSNSGSEGST